VRGDGESEKAEAEELASRTALQWRSQYGRPGAWGWPQNRCLPPRSPTGHLQSLGPRSISNRGLGGSGSGGNGRVLPTCSPGGLTTRRCGLVFGPGSGRDGKRESPFRRARPTSPLRADPDRLCGRQVRGFLTKQAAGSRNRRGELPTDTLYVPGRLLEQAQNDKVTGCAPAVPHAKSLTTSASMYCMN
jgi:hypothetical protein